MFSDVTLPTYATTIAGAILPILLAMVTALFKLWLRRLEKKWELGHEETLKGQAKTMARLAEAEGALRGDLKNGVKQKLDSIDEKVTKVTERQNQTAEQNQEADSSQ